MTHSRTLRLAIIMDIINPVPPIHYGGIERIVHMMVENLTKRGHRVTLFASDDSSVSCRLIPFGHRRSQQLWVEWSNTIRLFTHLLRHCREFDLVHCLGRTLYLLPLLPFLIPKVQTYMCPINRRKLKMVHGFAGDSLTFVACSQSVAKQGAQIGQWKVIPNGIPLEKYEYKPLFNGREKYLVFLGRLHRIKGVHTAIKVAQATGKKLKIAGTAATSGPEFDYFKEEIEPHIDGKQIEYVGPVDDKEKNILLGKAEALLFPIEWEEPMAVVMLEALGCGLPVIAFNRGSISEILTDGVNGFICASLEEMISAVGKLGTIDRRECRRTIETRFSSDLIVSQYEELYYKLLSKNHRNKTSFIQSSEPEYVASQHLFTDLQ